MDEQFCQLFRIIFIRLFPLTFQIFKNMFIYFPQFLNYRLFIHQYLLLTILSNQGQYKSPCNNEEQNISNENLQVNLLQIKYYQLNQLKANLSSSSMSFISLFIQTAFKECDQPTYEAIPDTTLVLNPMVQQILQKPTSLCTITALLRSNLAQRFIRSAIFQQEHLNDEHPETAVIWDKIETGYTSSNELINWIYIEVNNKYNLSCLPMISSLSCTIIYEQQNLENDRIFLLRAIQNFKSITGKSPVIFYLRNQDEKQNLLKQELNLHQIYLPKDIQLSGTSNIKNIFQIGRKIIDDSFSLQSKKNAPISAAIIPFYFKLWNQQSSLQQLERPQKIWKCAVKQFQSQIEEKCILEYRNRMLKLYEDKKFISMKLVKNSHQISMQIALKSVQKYKSADQNIQQKLDSMIKEELNKILEEIVQINYKWGQNFIETEYLQIENRLKSKQFKSINSIKNQFNLLRQYFYKKSQSLSCKKLEHYFSQFVLDKSFDSCSYIIDSQKKSLCTEISELKEKLALVENQLKQSKRQLTKQLNISLKNVEGLEQRISSLKNKEELLEGTIEQLKQDRNIREKENEEKINQIQERFNYQIGKLRQQNSWLMDEVSEQKKNKSILESEIQKEKQMHRQTSQHYKQVVSELKNKEGLLLDEIAEVTKRATQQLQQYRKDTQRSLSKSSMSQSEKEREGLKMVEEINQINQKYAQLQKAFNHLEYEMQLKKAEQSVLKNDLQIALKIAEQKIYDYEVKMPRLLKMEQQIGAYEQMMEEHSTKQKEIEKQTALLRQQNSFIMEHIQEIQQKYEDEKLQNRDLKVNLQDLQQKLGKMNRVMVNEWVQTENDNKFREMLTDALNMVTVLENQYNKVKVENHKLRYRSSNY